MRYKNTTFSTYTVHGVTFNPGDIHTVPRRINIAGFIPLPDEEILDTEFRSESLAKSETSKKIDVGKSTKKETSREKESSKIEVSDGTEAFTESKKTAEKTSTTESTAK